MKVALHSTAKAPHLPALLIGRILSAFSLFAPWQPSASPVSVRRGLPPRTPKLTVTHATAALGIVLAVSAGVRARAPGELVASAPVIVELFTSEGCSSCPPADNLLRSLTRMQPVPGVVIIPLSQHVDYWDRLGWRDRFSSPQFTERQRAYAEALGVGGIYTPQLVIDGRVELVGSRGKQAGAEIRRAGDEPKTPIVVEATFTPGHPEVSLTAKVGAPPAGSQGQADVWLAITEHGLTTDVKAGENMFRRLHHTGVVRHLERLGSVSAEHAPPRHLEARVRLAPDWGRDALRAVVFLQDPATLHISGAAQIAVR